MLERVIELKTRFRILNFPTGRKPAGTFGTIETYTMIVLPLPRDLREPIHRLDKGEVIINPYKGTRQDGQIIKLHSQLEGR